MAPNEKTYNLLHEEVLNNMSNNMNRLIQILKDTFSALDLEKNSPLGVGCCEGWDSLGHFNLLMSIEEEFGIRFSVEEISESKSMDQIATVLKSKGVEI